MNHQTSYPSPEFGDFVPANDGSLNWVDSQHLYSQIAPEEVESTCFKSELTYRATSVLAPAPAPFDCADGSERIFEKFQSKLSICVTEPDFCGSAPPFPIPSLYTYVEPDSFEIAPEPPFLLFSTHFYVRKSLSEVKNAMNGFLKETAGISFELNEDILEVRVHPFTKPIF